MNDARRKLVTNLAATYAAMTAVKAVALGGSHASDLAPTRARTSA